MCVLETDGLLVLCSTKPTVPGVWKLSAFWSHPPCAGLKCFLVAEEHGNADQAALEADKKTVCFWDSFGEKNATELFLYSEREHLLWSRESLW